MDKMNDYVEKAGAATKETYESAMEKALILRNQALVKMNIDPSDLEKLNRVPLIVAFVGVLVNFLLLAAISNNAWLEGTAMADGQPFQVHLSLGSAIFGPNSDPKRDTKYFCEYDTCSLHDLCLTGGGSATFENGMPKDTPQKQWCTAANAGSVVGGLLGFGFIPGLAATALSFMYAAKEIQYFASIFQKVEGMGLREDIQKYIVCGCWGFLWLFMIAAMGVYSVMIPDTMGWGSVHLEASFGLLRFSLMLISIFGGILVSHLLDLWIADNVTEAYIEFAETKLLSWKKALYLELLLQMALYLLLTVYMVDWTLLLVILVGYYLDAKVKNFKLMYIVLVSISLLFDTMRYAALPSVSMMTPGESFGNFIWTIIYLLKPLILVTIYFYEKEGDPVTGFAKMEDMSRGMAENDEIAE